MPIGDSETMVMVDATALAPGSDFGTRYRIEALLGQGGMGRVYKAYDKDLDRVVALKVVRHGAMGESDALKRFKQEQATRSKFVAGTTGLEPATSAVTEWEQQVLSTTYKATGDCQVLDNTQ